MTQKPERLSEMILHALSMTKIKYTSSNEVDFVAGYNVKVVNGKIVFESIEDYNERKANEKALRMANRI